MVPREIVIEIEAAAPERARFEQLVRRTLEAEGRSLGRVTVSFVDTVTIKALNRKHRGQAKPTDVLSWPFDASFPQGDGGEVVICREQAEPTGPATIDRLLVHGVLHLLGYKDETGADLAEMERRTDRILENARG